MFWMRHLKASAASRTTHERFFPPTCREALDDAQAPRAQLLLVANGMTSIPRDSHIIGAVTLLAIVLVTGLVRVFGF